MHNSYDIVITGGGMVGLTLAALLAEKTTLSICVIEANAISPVWSAQHYAHRVSAIALASQNLLQSISVWDEIVAKRVSPFTRIHVWDEAGKGEIAFASQEIGQSALGFIIENNAILSALINRIHAYSTITYLTGVTLEAFHQEESGLILITSDQQKIHAELAIAADGAHSWLRHQANISMTQKDYEQTAIVATVTTEKNHEQTAQQVFLSDGPLAFLPLLQPNTSSIVWSLPTARAQAMLTLDEAQFNQALTQAFSHRLGEVQTCSERFSFKLCQQQVQHYVKERLALVGDAAHVMHPLAGQGVNVGLQDASALAQVIIDAVRAQRRYYSWPSLRRYERWRKAENSLMLTGIDTLKTLFASENPALQRARSFGLNATNRTRWFKNLFTRHAVGMGFLA